MSSPRMSLAISLVGTLIATAVFAQGSYEQHKDQIELTRWSIQSERKAAVADNLQLSEQESKAFWPLYDDYRTAMGKVGEAHQPHRDGEADRNDEQHHARCDATEGDTDHIHVRGKLAAEKSRRPSAYRGGGLDVAGRVARCSYLHLPTPSSLHLSLTAGVVARFFW